MDRKAGSRDDEEVEVGLVPVECPRPLKISSMLRR